jgi:hypothetical protein
MQDYSVWYQNHVGTPKDQKLLPQTPQEQGKILKGNENSKMAVALYARHLQTHYLFQKGILVVHGLQKCRDKKGMKFKVST